MVKFINGVCKICNSSVKIEIPENMRIDEAINAIRNMKGFKCPGNHIEIGSPFSYCNFDLTNIYTSDDETTDKDILKKLTDRGYDILTNDEFKARYKEDIITFSGGFCIVELINGDKIKYNYMTLPESLKRIYYKYMKGESL